MVIVIELNSGRDYDGDGVEGVHVLKLVMIMGKDNGD